MPRLLTEIGKVASRIDDGNIRDQLLELAHFISGHFPSEVDAYVIFLAD